MRKTVSLLIALCFILSFNAREARAEMPVKARAFITIVGYGTAGGALLGAASMAFGNSTRAVFQGASLGLYAGILFGTYVLVSHHNRRSGNYEDSSSPYQDSRDIYGDGYNAEEGGTDQRDNGRGGFFERMQTLEMKFQSQKKGSQVPPLYLNLIQYNF